MKKGKNYQESAKLIDRSVQYDAADACALVVNTAKAKFDETVEVHIRLGVDSRHADQQVRGSVVLPNGTGKTRKVLVFAKDAKADAAPKAGTVTPDVAKAIGEIKAGKIEYRLDKTNIIHCPIGKVSFGSEKLVENFDTLIGAIIKAKPAAAKGQYIKSCVLASTMGPGIKVSTAKY